MMVYIYYADGCINSNSCVCKILFTIDFYLFSMVIMILRIRNIIVLRGFELEICDYL